MHAGHIISGAGHAALIGWVLFGGAFQSDPPPIEVTEVSVISASDFAALTTAPDAATEIALPQAPSETEAALPSASEAQPVTQQDVPEVTESPELETVPEAPLPEPVPEILDETTAPAAPLPSPAVPQVSNRPVPRPSERIAPEAVEAPEPETAPAPVEQAAVTPEEAPVETPQEEQEATAPEEAATEITTEAETPSSAPQTSLRPPSRRPAPPTQTTEAPDAQTSEPEPDTNDDAVNAALAEALGGSDTQPDVPTGPPMTAGEKDGLRVAVQQCWNVGALSSAALETTVVVAVSMTEDGKPVSGSIRMLSSSGGNAGSAKQAFDAARRAILRCGAKGYDLPAEKFGQWKEIEMTFNPERMRIK